MANLTRREFGVNLATGVTGLKSLTRYGKLEPSIVGGVRIGVQSYTFRKFTIDKMIAAMRSIGLSYVELWDGHLNPMKTNDAGFR